MSVENKCPKCDGKGVVEWLKPRPNGELPDNKCFTCAGKGYTTGADRRRNYVYWQQWRPKQTKALANLELIRQTLGIPS